MSSTPTIDASSVADEVNETIQTISSMDLKTLWSVVWDFFVRIFPMLLTAGIIFLVGFLLIRLLMSFSRRLLKRSKIDLTLHHFILSILRICLYVVLAITVLSILLPDAVAGLIATLSIFGLAISLAVKDSLANLAGGISVLFTKPFALGDYVSIGSTEGNIKEIRLNYTILSTIDNKIIHIPNGDVSKAQIINFTNEPTRRLDLVFSIGYHDDFEEAKQIIRDLLAAHPLALTEPEPVVRMLEQGTSSIHLTCRVWVNTPDYWSLRFDLLEQVKTSFDKVGISIPFQQLEVNLRQNSDPRQ